MRLPSLAIPEPPQKKPGAEWVRDSHGHMQVSGRIRGYFTQEIALAESIQSTTVYMAQYDFKECKLIKSVLLLSKVDPCRLIFLNSFSMLFLILIKGAGDDFQSSQINRL